MTPRDRNQKSRKNRGHARYRRRLLQGISVMTVFGIVTAAYIFSYRLSSHRQPQSETSKESTSGVAGEVLMAGQGASKEETGEETAGPGTGQKTGENEALPANENQELYITPRMSYTLQSYDARTESLTEEKTSIPTAMYGLNREELSAYLANLSKLESEGLSEEEIRYDLISFSRDSFTVRRTVSEKVPEYALFLIAEGGYLTAYTGDLTEVYEYTQIPLGEFPLEQQAMLTKGIFMKSLADYYDFLETYSS